MIRAATPDPVDLVDKIKRYVSEWVEYDDEICRDFIDLRPPEQDVAQYQSKKQEYAALILEACFGNKNKLEGQPFSDGHDGERPKSLLLYVYKRAPAIAAELLKHPDDLPTPATGEDHMFKGFVLSHMSSIIRHPMANRKLDAVNTYLDIRQQHFPSIEYGAAYNDRPLRSFRDGNDDPYAIDKDEMSIPRIMIDFFEVGSVKDVSEEMYEFTQKMAQHTDGAGELRKQNQQLKQDAAINRKTLIQTRRAALALILIVFGQTILSCRTEQSLIFAPRPIPQNTQSDTSQSEGHDEGGSHRVIYPQHLWKGDSLQQPMTKAINELRQQTRT